MTITEAIKELMNGWNTIEKAAKEQFPKATNDEIYHITAGAMDYSLGLSSNHQAKVNK